LEDFQEKIEIRSGISWYFAQILEHIQGLLAKDFQQSSEGHEVERNSG